MQSTDSQFSSSSSGAQKDETALFLLKKFFRGNDCDRPSKIDDTHFDYAQETLRMDLTEFVEMRRDRQKNFISKCARALVKVLNPQHDKSKLEARLEELSPNLEEVFRGQSDNLRPFLDILIIKGVYTDPDSIVISRHAMGIADSKRAWTLEYQGQAHVTLLDNIQRSFHPLAYANNGSIIQSSGYGKSRTVDAMAKLIPTIPMNIRAVAEANEGAFPPTDTSLIDLFDDMGKRFTDPVNRLHLFFAELFRIVRDLAQGFEGENFAKNLYDHFNDQGKRTKFYADLLEIMEKNPVREQVLSAVHEINIGIQQGDGSASMAYESFKGLAKLFPESQESVKMVIYVDEAHEFSQNSKRPSIYDHVLQAAAELASVGVFFLFLSTASGLEVLASRAALARSARFRLRGDHLVAPFTQMPFDCHPKLVKERIQPGLMLEEIQKFSFAVRFGRPLFWAYYEAMLLNGKDKSGAQWVTLSMKEKVTQGYGEDHAHTNTIAMAVAKLISNQTLTMHEASPGKLAVLDTLLNLEYDPRRTHSDQLASTMVASHMRTVYSVPPSRAYMHTGYPSEPVLAEAALTYIDSLQATDESYTEEATIGPLFSIYQAVDTHTAAGAIDKGERGENVGKMILLLAYTAAVKKAITQGPHPQFWGKGCSLVSFLTELTRENYCCNVLESIPNNIEGGLPLEKKFENSWVRFTHFARAADDSAMTSSSALAAFIRGMAMIGWQSQIAVDVNIPILLDKNKPITESNMSSILVQFKVRSAPTAEDKVAVDAEKIKYFPPPGSSRDVFAKQNAPEDERKEYHTRPYISLVMELGLVPTSSSGRIRRKVVDLLDNRGSKSPASKDTTPKPTGPTAPFLNVHSGSGPPVAARTRSKGDISSPHIHPRYSLFYHGCSHKIYRCIRATEEQACRALLQIPTVFNDGPKGRSVDPVLQMKPFWSVGKNSYSWLNEPYLNQEDWERELHDDQVLVGDPMDTDTDDSDVMDESL